MAASSQPIARDQWGSKIEVLLSYIGYCVGLGNAWRFPYLCYRNGGGAFLIPYLIVLTLAGIPLYFLEITLGQYSSCGATTVWKFCPFFKGTGYVMVMMCILCCYYYNQLIVYIMYYLFASMTSELPWATCDNEWNTPNCVPVIPRKNSNSTLEVMVSNATQATSALLTYATDTGNVSTVVNNLTKSSADEFWRLRVLHLSEGIENMGTMDWRLVLLLLLAWLLTFACLFKGIKSTGKVVYVTATFPYIVLTILLIRGCTLPGAGKGLLYFIVPEWSKLANTKVWGDAASQIFFSLGQCWGILITYGSYNKFDHRSNKDAVIACGVCALTSILCGCVVFSVIGFLSYELGVPIDKVMTSGPGLVFVVYPEALARMPIAPMWSIIFFLMLFTLALNTQFATFAAAIDGFADEFPNQIRPIKTWFTLGACLFMFVIGLPLSMQGGIYLLNVLDWYVATFPPMIVGIIECVSICYIYGYRRFMNDITLMMGFSPGIYWKACWLCITPTIVLFIIIFNAAVYVPVTYGDYVYPKWGEGIGWATCCGSLSFIPIFMVGSLWWKAGSVREFIRRPLYFLREVLKPADDWGPPHLRNASLDEKEPMELERNDNIVDKIPEKQAMV
jgi:solute carrier family 6 amino acid transporter-like protein 5/7/9/14